MRERGRDAAHDEWTALLDDFARAVASGEPLPWAAAVHRLPASLAGRAREILSAQRRRATDLARERDDVHAHLAALRRVPQAPAEHPAYLDLQG